MATNSTDITGIRQCVIDLKSKIFAMYITGQKFGYTCLYTYNLYLTGPPESFLLLIN